MGCQTPIEKADGTVIAFTKRDGTRYYQHEMTVEEFNILAPSLFTARRMAGWEYIPQVVVEESPDPVVAPPTVVTFSSGGATVSQLASAPIEISEISGDLSATPANETVGENALIAPGYNAIIGEHIPAKSHRFNDLCNVIKVDPELLRTFIESEASEFHIESGGWVKPN